MTVAPMTVAVVGANGFLGRHLAAYLADRGWLVKRVLREESLPEGQLEAVIDCNGDSRRFWANANPIESFRANVAAVAERLNATPNGAAYVYMSTIDVYGAGRGRREATLETKAIDPLELDTYSLHKFLAEQLVAFHARPAQILRLGTLIGPGLKKNPVFDALNGHPIRQTPDSTLSLIDLDHVALVLEALLATKAKGIFNVTSSRAVMVSDMLAMVSEAAGIEPAAFHSELLHTDYDIDISAISTYVEMPTSAAMLRAYLETAKPDG